jgi:hypothetical protein
MNFVVSLSDKSAARLSGLNKVAAPKIIYLLNKLTFAVKKPVLLLE